jgi:hypothetical protein
MDSALLGGKPPYLLFAGLDHAERPFVLTVPQAPVDPLKRCQDPRLDAPLPAEASPEIAGDDLQNLEFSGNMLPVEDGSFINFALAQQRPQRLVAIGKGGDLSCPRSSEVGQAGLDALARRIFLAEQSTDDLSFARYILTVADQDLVMPTLRQGIAAQESRIDAEIDPVAALNTHLASINVRLFLHAAKGGWGYIGGVLRSVGKERYSLCVVGWSMRSRHIAISPM